MKKRQKLMQMLAAWLFLLALPCFAACNGEGGEQTSAALSSAAEVSSAQTAAGETLAPLGERGPGEGREDREYLLQEGGELEEPVEFTLEILGKSFTQEDAANLSLYTGEVEIETTVEAHTHVYVGYRLVDILDYLELEIDGDFSVAAADGYALTCAAEDLNDNVLIALSRNGRTDDAPYYAPCSKWSGAEYIRELAKIELKAE